jgi:3-deoxy-D-manno-octulosonic-acid transferase
MFVDSEIWPNLLMESHRRGVKLALVNGRMSQRSFAGWSRAPKTAAAILSLYDVCLAQDDETADRLRKLGARVVSVSGGLKADAPPLPADGPKFAMLTRAVGDRPVFLAASTHAGEDDTLLSAQDALRPQFPGLLTIIAPRHPERGADIAKLCGTRNVLRLSQGDEPRMDTAVYVADTVGELGLFYRLAPFAFMGGSLVPHGGQNPLEAARLGRAIMAGPFTDNFSKAYEAIFAAQNSGRVATGDDIVTFAARLLHDARTSHLLGGLARDAAKSLGGALEKTHLAIEAMLAHASA